MVRVRCHVNQENLNIDWLAIRWCQEIVDKFVSGDNDISYVRKCPYF